MAFRRVERGVGSDKWDVRIISGWMLGGYKIAQEWHISWRWEARREKQCIFGGGVLRILNVAMRHENNSPTDRTDRHRRETPPVFA